MADTLEITAEAVRQNLLARVANFRQRTGCSLSFIGEQALRDSKFLANVQRGDNFTIRTYQRVIDWLDAEDAKASAA